MSGPRKIHRNKALPVEERENSWESGGKAVEKCGKLPSAFLLREEEMPNLQNGNHGRENCQRHTMSPKANPPGKPEDKPFLGLSPRIFAALFSRPLA